MTFSYTFCPYFYQPGCPPYFLLSLPACLSCSLFINQLSSVRFNTVVGSLQSPLGLCNLRQQSHLASLHIQHQLVFPPQYEDSPTHLRTTLNQPDVSRVASFVAECLTLFPGIILAPFLVWLQAFPSSRSDAPQRHIQRCKLSLTNQKNTASAVPECLLPFSYQYYS